MTETRFQNRRAVQIENEKLRVTVLAEGGHIAEILEKKSGVNPLWIPAWPSIEPSAFDRARHTGYGADAAGKMLAGIMGHNLCMDIFGGVSDEEAAAGLTPHGEASVVPYEIQPADGGITARALLPIAQLRFERRLTLDGERVHISETVENLTGADRPIGWTQHVTLGPPFLERGATQFRVPATRSKVFESDFAEGKGYMKIGAEFLWPHVPHKDSGTVDLRVYSSLPGSSAFSTHLMDPARPRAFFLAWSPASKTMLGYVWKRADFPWIGIWEENCARDRAPWNARAITRGMEFGVSPMPETRRQMIERGGMFGEKGFRWIPAKSTVRVDYYAFVRQADSIPEEPPA